MMEVTQDVFGMAISSVKGHSMFSDQYARVTGQITFFDVKPDEHEELGVIQNGKYYLYGRLANLSEIIERDVLEEIVNALEDKALIKTDLGIKILEQAMEIVRGDV